MPVKTIARFSRSAAAMTSSSRTDPPGWMIAVAPFRAASSTPSGNGKKASEPTTVPASGRTALAAPILTESEEHVDWLETQLSLIKDVGLQLYLQHQIGEEAGGH